jgi:hypothetical protein
MIKSKKRKEKIPPMPKGWKEGIIWMACYHLPELIIFLVGLIVVILVWKFRMTVVPDPVQGGWKVKQAGFETKALPDVKKSVENVLDKSASKK